MLAAAPSADPLDSFVAAAAAALADGGFFRVVLAKPLGPGAEGARRVDGRLVTLKGELRLSFTAAHATGDLIRNLPVAAAVGELRRLLDRRSFGHARLETTTGALELLTSRKGRRTLLKQRPAVVPGSTAIPNNAAAPATAAPARPSDTHDHVKRRRVPLDRPYLAALGVTDAAGRLVPAMARKWKQIDKFVELLDGALASTGLKQAPGRLDLVDFGCGKGYLTFAAHDHLRHALGLASAQVLGVELRGELVDFCNAAAGRLGLDGLRFEEGDVRSIAPPAIDVMIALHACDTATDFALATGVAAGAKVIMASPCCHKELRPQLLSPHPLRPILKHGVHLGQEAEMLTDGLRALLLEACGYETQVFEFVALEHTLKNKMILALRRPEVDGPAAERRSAEIGRQIDEIKRFYGIREQCLERLLRDRLPALQPA